MPGSSSRNPGRTRYFPMPEKDRKSTRLNSSHSQISYAVFCLKKKKLHYAISTVKTLPNSCLHQFISNISSQNISIISVLSNCSMTNHLLHSILTTTTLHHHAS